LNKISAHFSQSELSCNCGCNRYVEDKRLIDLLELIRAYISAKEKKQCPVVVHCGLRCANHNYRIGGVSSSRHLPLYFSVQEGAADFHCRGISVKKLHKHCKELYKKGLIKGLGLYSWGVHVDNSKKRQWRGK